MSQDDRKRSSTSSMPLDRAFVVQFRQSRDGASGWFAGRVEHVLSGNRTDFLSPQALMDFFGQVMNQSSPPT